MSLNDCTCGQEGKRWIPRDGFTQCAGPETRKSTLVFGRVLASFGKRKGGDRGISGVE